MRTYAENQRRFERHYATLRRNLEEQYTAARDALARQATTIRDHIQNAETENNAALERRKVILQGLSQELNRLDLTPAQVTQIRTRFNQVNQEVINLRDNLRAALNHVQATLMPVEYTQFMNLNIR